MVDKPSFPSNLKYLKGIEFILLELNIVNKVIFRPCMKVRLFFERQDMY